MRRNGQSQNRPHKHTAVDEGQRPRSLLYRYPPETVHRILLQRRRRRRDATTDLERRLFMAGIATPSPIPIQALAVRRAGNPRCAANGVTAVAMDHQTTPKPAQTYALSVASPICKPHPECASLRTYRPRCRPGSASEGNPCRTA